MLHEQLHEQEFDTATWCFLEELEARGTVAVNPLTTWIEHNSKGQLYEKLRAWGFPTPLTLSTNTPAQVRAFFVKAERAVVKPGRSGLGRPAWWGRPI
ncbi:MAG: hypothetical protein FD153_1022 [Rhodospirillaceae bacterium]|nr:MAG: hypothetical protein FD153_1022 [Rhodospirillaceae bacterium]